MKFFFSIGFSHPWMPAALYLPLVFLISFLSLSVHARPILSILFLLLLGLFSWTLLEYALHRFVFHLTVHTEPWKTLLAEAHLKHHEMAHRADYVLVIPGVSLLFALLV